MPHPSLFPKVGFISEGVACGFVYFTDSPVAIIDCYLSNPNSDAQVRSKALDEITEALIKIAAFHKCQVIKCDTSIISVMKRAEKFGFKSIGSHESYALEL